MGYHVARGIGLSPDQRAQSSTVPKPKKENDSDSEAEKHEDWELYSHWTGRPKYGWEGWSQRPEYQNEYQALRREQGQHEDAEEANPNEPAFVEPDRPATV